jgi:ATP-dependent Lon protease
MPQKRKPRNPRSRTVSENPPDDGPPPTRKRQRKGTKDEGTIWINDDTLDSSDDEKPVIAVDTEQDDSDYEPEEEDEEFIQYLLEKYVAKDDVPPPDRKLRSKKEEPLPLKLTKVEQDFYDKQSNSKKKELVELMKGVSGHDLNEGDIPHKFKVLQLPISDYVKSTVIKKITTLAESRDIGEGHKLRNWVDAFMRIPFGKTVPLPVSFLDGREKCTQFMVTARKQMDKHIYGMETAKLQILQIMAQWIVNPDSVGNVIALAGPPGIGKTTLARTAIAEVLQRPFEFFTLGGASDIANYVGHSYTYEGSLWGRIVDSLMHAKTMNPVMYFDELDKISTTPQGEEITSMMIHMTDRSQNTQFHDRYFAGVDLDLSQCLFVFSFNDLDKVSPILRDRMNIIHCGGYSDKDKTVILNTHIIPDILERLRFTKEEVTFSESAIKYIISEFSSEEKGVRNLIRTIESIMTRLNMLRIANDSSMKDYKFYMDLQFPLVITEDVVKTLLGDFSKKEPESWRSLYC